MNQLLLGATTVATLAPAVTAPPQSTTITVPSVHQDMVGNTIATLINSAFGPYSGSALTVARCESGLSSGAHGRNNAMGVFQILHATWTSTSQAGQSPYNAAANIKAAHEIFVRDGYSWREWSCQP